MAEQNTLVDLKVTMKKHPDSLKLEGSLKELLEKSLPLTEPLILYNGRIFEECFFRLLIMIILNAFKAQLKRYVEWRLIT